MEELMKNQMFATHAVAAAGSVTLGTALTYPLDTIKVLIQVRSLKPTSVCICMLICVCLTTAQVLDRVKTLSGHAGLYSGFGWLMLGRILGAGARFGAYEILTAFYKGCDALACAFASLAFGSIIMSGGTTFWFRLFHQYPYYARYQWAYGGSDADIFVPFLYRYTWQYYTVRYITTALMDAKLGTEGRKDLFDWLSRQLSGLSRLLLVSLEKLLPNGPKWILMMQRVSDGTGRIDPRFPNQCPRYQAHRETYTRVQRETESPPANPPTSNFSPTKGIMKKMRVVRDRRGEDRPRGGPMARVDRAEELTVRRAYCEG
ncbi:hypothetical protein HYC85_012147 [Camellia sinensis]|uniref:Uncharacterized protein n=1 Tax=Camellia sinensis TaxID=4442 RepID=A0A7J7HE23_CAMSI|nr:hypothetical protein HYC85_012147 [Camellia sinensis]